MLLYVKRELFESSGNFEKSHWLRFLPRWYFMKTVVGKLLLPKILKFPFTAFSLSTGVL